MAKRILIVDDIHPLLMRHLTSEGMECDYFPDMTYQEAIPLISTYHGLVIRSKFHVGSEFIHAAKSLEFIARAGAGMDNIDVLTTERRHIQLLNAPEGNRNAVAEHTMGLLLSIMNKLQKGDKEIRQGIWDREGNRGLELSGRTIGIIGYGFMGSAFAEKLTSFQVNILAFDKYKRNFGTDFVKEVPLEEIWNTADILSLHIPLTEETHFSINSEFFSRFKKPIFLINTARGEILNIEDLLKALDEGKILAAALDVLPEEKFPLSDKGNVWFKDLITRDKALLSPHVAGWTIESYKRIAETLVDKILTFYRNKST